jgi:hypothetical protein
LSDDFCKDYGSVFSVLVLNDASLAPFHPIPKGQAAIAAVLRKSFPDR